MTHHDTDLEKSRVVSLKFGLWKNDDCCYEPKGVTRMRGPVTCATHNIDYVGNYHVVQSPDLLSSTGADLLMTALNQRKLRVTHDQSDCYIGGNNQQFHGIGPSWRHALLDATYKLATEKSNAD